MAEVGIQGLIALGVAAIVGIYVIAQFLPLIENESAVVVVLAGLIPVLVAYVVIRAYL